MIEFGEPPTPTTFDKGGRQATERDIGQERTNPAFVIRSSRHYTRCRRLHEELVLAGLTLHPNRKQSRCAFLDQQALPWIGDAELQYRMGAANGRVAGETDFAGRCKNADAIAGGGFGGRQQKCCFHQVGPARERLHLFCTPAIRIDNHAQRIAAAPRAGEYIQL